LFSKKAMPGDVSDEMLAEKKIFGRSGAWIFSFGGFSVVFFFPPFRKTFLLLVLAEKGRERGFSLAGVFSGGPEKKKKKKKKNPISKLIFLFHWPPSSGFVLKGMGGIGGRAEGAFNGLFCFMGIFTRGNV